MNELDVSAQLIKQQKDAEAISILEKNTILLTDDDNDNFIQLLYIAIESGSYPVVDYLLKLKHQLPDIAFQKYFSYTPIGLAVTLGHNHLIPLLTKHADKCFSLYVATKFQRWNVVNELKKSACFNPKFLNLCSEKSNS